MEPKSFLANKPFLKHYSHQYGQKFGYRYWCTVTLLIIFFSVFKFGIFPVIAIYIGPLLVVNSWLVVYTCHHTDSDVPHLPNKNFPIWKGIYLLTGLTVKSLIFFIIIGSSHVVHHVCPTIPHYHAKKATALIKKPLKSISFNPDPTQSPLEYCLQLRSLSQISRE